jgi:hypothetical protein
MTIDQMTDTRVIIKGLKMHRTVLKRVVETYGGWCKPIGLAGGIALMDGGTDEERNKWLVDMGHPSIESVEARIIQIKRIIDDLNQTGDL